MASESNCSCIPGVVDPWCDHHGDQVPRVTSESYSVPWPREFVTREQVGTMYEALADDHPTHFNCRCNTFPLTGGPFSGGGLA